MLFLKKYKKIFSFLIIGGAIIASIFIVRGGQEQKPDYLFEVVKNTVETPRVNIENPLPNLTTEFTTESLKKLMSEKNNIVAQEKNDVSQAQTLPDKTAVEKIVGDIIDKELASEAIDPKTIHTLSDNSQKAQIVYLLLIQEIIRGGLNNPAVEGSTSASLQSYFSNVAKNSAATASLLKTMNVPPSWVDIHTNLVEFFLSQNNLYASLAAGESDPLRFMIAMQRIPQEIETRFDVIKKKIEERIKEQKLI